MLANKPTWSLWENKVWASGNWVDGSHIQPIHVSGSSIANPHLLLHNVKTGIWMNGKVLRTCLVLIVVNRTVCT